MQQSQKAEGSLLLDVSCISGGYCAAVGQYNGGVMHWPVSYISSDYGVNWALSTTQPLPIEESLMSSLMSISCVSNGRCAAVGVSNDGHTDVPLSYVSSDFGVHWALSKTQPLPLQGSLMSSLTSISCVSSGHCAAAGVLNYGHIDRPLSYVSSDFGVHWVLSKTQPLPPQGSIMSSLASISALLQKRIIFSRIKNKSHSEG